MPLLQFKFLALLLGAVMMTSMVAAKAPPPIPKHFKAQIGGFLGNSYEVELRDGKIYYTAFGPERKAKAELIVPSAAQWYEFRRSLAEIKIWEWRPSYLSVEAQDGTQWSLDIAYDDRALKTLGHNNYPEANGRSNNSPELTETFKAYGEGTTRWAGVFVTS